MSISERIIYGTVADVEKAVQFETSLDLIDEYGYTPLIQCAIVNDIKKTEVILNAGASVDFKDLTGRSALHWAADNQNVELARILLERGANPNGYTNAGQPLLVLPFLRNHKKTKDLLYAYKADLNFAKDFINAKLMGHRFELTGRVDLADPNNTFFEMEFEGFYLEFSLALVTASLWEFPRHYSGKKLRPYFGIMDTITQSLQTASELIRYQHYLIDTNKYDDRIQKLLNTEPLVIPIAFDGHAICFIKYRDWLIRCDRGAFGRDNGTIIFYQMENPAAINKAMIKALIYRRQDRHFINEEFPRIYKLSPMHVMPLPVQTSGNCSWANVEAVLPALLYLLIKEQSRGSRRMQDDEIEKLAMQFYDQWLDWDQNRSVHFFIQQFADANPARKASIASILAAILFQHCEFKNSSDRDKASKILPILTLPDYTYILKAYLKVFLPLQHNQQMKNLLEFFEEFGIDKGKFVGE